MNLIKHYKELIKLLILYFIFFCLNIILIYNYKLELLYWVVSPILQYDLTIIYNSLDELTKSYILLIFYFNIFLYLPFFSYIVIFFLIKGIKKNQILGFLIIIFLLFILNIIYLYISKHILYPIILHFLLYLNPNKEILCIELIPNIFQYVNIYWKILALRIFIDIILVLISTLNINRLKLYIYLLISVIIIVLMPSDLNLHILIFFQFFVEIEFKIIIINVVINILWSKHNNEN